MRAVIKKVTNECGESAWLRKGPAGILSSTHGEERVTGVQRLAIAQISASTFCAGLQRGREAGGSNIVEQIYPNVNLLGWDYGKQGGLFRAIPTV
ncbi:hypothetical protein MHYP_G00167170 [Metynnis hypsauchen]